ncbi:response regulator transcription factor (plasmid) [Chlorobium phaeovibrioides]|uniref:Response regulator transcription factor n=1 Tax=Chlorobium phaeovibrioides TaxID=1094 RepID=A0A5M8I5I2_CHLPH|nr:winged helix-turn-helix domain-containing protein [Chlorobium phaeovibrioides]KAA6230487.1 response regulator transcription factor [Chlorobium phaeovibrioides]
MPDNDTFLRRNSIIVVQEDEASRDRIVEQLTREVPGVIAIGSAADCNKLLKQEEFALAIIDEVLSDESGFVLARNIRTKTGIPVLMLLGEDSHDKRLAGYLAGAIGCMDRGDALTELPPLVANILDVEIKKKGAVVKEWEWRLLKHGWVLVSPSGEKVKLTINEFEFMEVLVSASPRPAIRQELGERLDYRNDIKGDKALEAVVHRLRQKIATIGGELILTAHGIGWGLSAPVNAW